MVEDGDTILKLPKFDINLDGQAKRKTKKKAQKLLEQKKKEKRIKKKNTKSIEVLGEDGLIVVSSTFLILPIVTPQSISRAEQKYNKSGLFAASCSYIAKPFTGIISKRFTLLKRGVKKVAGECYYNSMEGRDLGKMQGFVDWILGWDFGVQQSSRSGLVL